MVSAGLIHQGGVQVLTAVPLQPVHHGRGQAGALVGAGILGAHQLDHGDPVGAGHRVEGGHILSHLLVHIPIAAGTDGHGGHHIGHLTGDHGAGVASVGMPGGIDPALVDGIALRHILDQLPPEGDVVRPGGVPAVVVDGPGHAVVLRIGVCCGEHHDEARLLGHLEPLRIGGVGLGALSCAVEGHHQRHRLAGVILDGLGHILQPVTGVTVDGPLLLGKAQRLKVNGGTQVVSGQGAVALGLAQEGLPQSPAQLRVGVTHLCLGELYLPQGIGIDKGVMGKHVLLIHRGLQGNVLVDIGRLSAIVGPLPVIGHGLDPVGHLLLDQPHRHIDLIHGLFRVHGGGLAHLGQISLVDGSAVQHCQPGAVVRIGHDPLLQQAASVGVAHKVVVSGVWAVMDRLAPQGKGGAQIVQLLLAPPLAVGRGQGVEQEFILVGHRGPAAAHQELLRLLPGGQGHEHAGGAVPRLLRNIGVELPALREPVRLHRLLEQAGVGVIVDLVRCLLHHLLEQRRKLLCGGTGEVLNGQGLHLNGRRGGLCPAPGAGCRRDAGACPSGRTAGCEHGQRQCRRSQRQADRLAAHDVILLLQIPAPGAVLYFAPILCCFQLNRGRNTCPSSDFSAVYTGFKIQKNESHPKS